MTFAALIDAVADRQQCSRKVARGVVEGFIEPLGEAAWRDGRLVIPGLGAFNVRQRKPRRLMNIDTSLPMTLPSHRVLTCRVASSLRVRGDAAGVGP